MEVFHVYGSFPCIWKFSMYMESLSMYMEVLFPCIWKFSMYMEFVHVYGGFASMYMEVLYVYREYFHVYGRNISFISGWSFQSLE